MIKKVKIRVKKEKFKEFVTSQGGDLSNLELDEKTLKPFLDYRYFEKFKEEIPRYMIKHQVRPGLTGWAQVNGYRGDTSISKRIECDLYYIENWTLGFDFKIIIINILNYHKTMEFH